MSTKLRIFVVALCILQICLAANVPKNPPPIPSILEDLSKQTSELLNGLGSQVSQVLQAKDATQLQAIFFNNTQQFAARVSDITKNLQERIQSSNSEVFKVYSQVLDNLNKTVLNLQNQNPEVTAKVKQVEENLQSSLKTVMGEADKVTKTVSESTKGIQEDIAKLVKQAYENVLQTAQTLQKQLHEAANKP